MNTIVKYLRDAREELRKVTWPSQKQTTNSTLLVVAVSIIIAVFLGTVDYGLNKLLEYLLRVF